MHKIAKVPCGSCPYRRDVPSGIWERREYDKLPYYDNPTWKQPIGLFMCHQRNGNLCAGWVACHGMELLALRIAKDIDPAVYNYETSVPVFASGAEAKEHGVLDIKRPRKNARTMISGLQRKRALH